VIARINLSGIVVKMTNQTRRHTNMEDQMLNIKQVRNRLGLSHAEVINLVQSGRLRAYRYAGSGRLGRFDIRPETHGLRFKASDVDELIETSLVN
jgi:predicted DNA-binding transcriptional regulator AlpA